MGKEAKYIVRLTDEERQTLQQLVAGSRVARIKAGAFPFFRSTAETRGGAELKA
jgi:hypothetical protein